MKLCFPFNFYTSAKPLLKDTSYIQNYLLKNTAKKIEQAYLRYYVISLPFT